MKIKLSDHFTYSKLLRFVFPSIIMMVFTSIYGVVDGLFVSNFAGKTAFASINLVMPFVMILGGIGFMIGTGGTALVSKNNYKYRIKRHIRNACQHRCKKSELRLFGGDEKALENVLKHECDGKACYDSAVKNTIHHHLRLLGAYEQYFLVRCQHDLQLPVDEICR